MKKITLSVMIILLVFLFGCKQTSPVFSSQIALRFDGSVNDQDGKFLLFTISNELPCSIQFYEITPDRVSCAIQTQENGQWTDASLPFYCATGWRTTLLKPGESYQMKMHAYSFSKPWRVGMQYWEESSDGSINYELSHRVWTDTLSPIK